MAPILITVTAWGNSRPDELHPMADPPQSDPRHPCTELPLEKWHRDVKIPDIYEGTAQIMRMLVSRQLMGRSAAAS
ncbi:acyl-CoA dehydrogenase family protein [Nocardia vaccinii]|uniref:acyl-CoA dehydrogenase family protein n=1 Tax=Nocardia vaccinii TaxID=1822 RepID=UPI00082D699B|nr:acyl-CoA dehydrogenase family protein [Nocardia vaccinii]